MAMGESLHKFKFIFVDAREYESFNLDRGPQNRYLDLIDLEHTYLVYVRSSMWVHA